MRARSSRAPTRSCDCSAAARVQASSHHRLLVEAVIGSGAWQMRPLEGVGAVPGTLPGLLASPEDGHFQDDPQEQDMSEREDESAYRGDLVALGEIQGQVGNQA